MSIATNGWGEYQRLVLAELERLNKAYESLERRFSDINLAIALLKEENGKIKKLADDIAAQQKAIEKINQGDVIDEAITKYRNWIVGLIFTVIVALVIPSIAILLGLL